MAGLAQSVAGCRPRGWVIDMKAHQPEAFEPRGVLARVPGAVVVPPESLEWWRKKALQLAREGLLVGVFVERAAAQQWVSSKVLTERDQQVFLQIQ